MINIDSYSNFQAELIFLPSFFQFYTYKQFYFKQFSLA